MKLITAIVNKSDSTEVCDALSEKRFRFTRIATFGGFLRSKNITLLIGVEDNELDIAFDIIRTHCRERKEPIPSMVAGEPMMGGFVVNEVTVGGATVFVTNVEKFERM